MGTRDFYLLVFQLLCFKKTHNPRRSFFNLVTSICIPALHISWTYTGELGHIGQHIIGNSFEIDGHPIRLRSLVVRIRQRDPDPLIDLQPFLIIQIIVIGQKTRMHVVHPTQ